MLTKREMSICAEIHGFLNDSHTVRLGGSGEPLDLLSVYDCLKLCGVSTGHAARVQKYKSCVSDHGIVSAQPRLKYTQGALREPTARQQQIPMAKFGDIQRLVCFQLRRNMKSQEEIDAILEDFRIERKMFESAFAAQAEKQTVDTLLRCIPFVGVQQFKIDKFRIDVYFPEIRLAVECNENGHAGYDKDAETERHNFIREQLSCEIIAYDPYQPNFNILDVVRQIVEKLVTPSFQTWRKAVLQGPWVESK